MNITERIAGYERIEKMDEENNDIKRVEICDEAQAYAVTEAEKRGIYSGYSECWENGFVCKEIEDDVERESVEEEMNLLFIEKAEELIRDCLEIEDEEIEEEGEVEE